MEERFYDILAQSQRQHWWYAGRRSILRDVVADLVRGGLPHGALYDLGCGVGANLEVLEAFGPTIGVDTSEKAIDYCRQTGRTNVRLGNIATLDDLPAESGSVALLADVIEHLDDDRACLRGVERLLAPGGAVVITVPAFMFLWGPNDDISHHRRRYTAPGLREVVGPFFRIERVTYFNTLLFGPIALGRVVERLLRLPGGEEARVPARMVNRLLANVFGRERYILRRARFPFGVSLLCTARKRVS